MAQDAISLEEENKRFLQKVDPFFEELITTLLINKPQQPIDFIIEWLKNKVGYSGLSEMEQEELKTLRKEVKKLKQKQEEQSFSEEDEEEEELPQPVKQKKGARGGVSSEVYGKYNPKGSYVPKVVYKNEEQKVRIVDRLSKAFMFAALDNNERQIVVDAMEEHKFKVGQDVIRQGDDGNVLYVVDTGTLQCKKLFPGKKEPTNLKVYHPGESFGELALLYNVPRAATITALEPCILWSLDRDCFNNIVKDSAIKKRERYEQFLSSVPLLKEMDAYERSQIADVLQPLLIEEDDFIIREGQEGNDFFLLEEGQAIATKTLKEGKPPQKVYEYKPGDYFGELALLRNEPRAANVVAITTCKCVKIDRLAFKRLLGPLDEILKRNAAVYEKYTRK